MSLQDSSGTSSVLDETWISWFCNMQGNQALCEVDKPFIEDSFNLFGLKQFVPTEFTKALTTIVDRQGNI
jgi:casein kinase II subunit beta